MENEIYNENEVKFFTDVFSYVKNSFRCDISGNISAQDIHDFLLTSSKLSKDVISQIGDITGGVIQGWYGEKQFFLALKLVAAAQHGIPVTADIPFLEIDLPLPELFTNNNNTEYDRPCSKDAISKQHKYESSPNLINLSDSDCPPPKASDNGYQIMISEDGEDEVVEGVYSEPTSNFTSHSPSVSSPASDSPTPTNSGEALEKRWNEPLNAQWHIIVNEEHHQLLGTEEESSDRHSSEGKDEEEEEEKEEDYNDGGNEDSEKETVKMEEKCTDNDEEGEKEKEEDSIELNDEEDDVWMVTEEQQQYYTKQFTIMQPDLSGFLPGTIAKQFFEKSKLPVAELRQIWQLADVSRDGALSLDEFFAAMHLVVLRRNKIPLPDKLPKALLPKSFKWTKFIDSPTSTLSSPGSKPVNFDFHKSALEKDPKILHPTPLRVTPEAKRLDIHEESVIPPSQEKEIEGSVRETCTINLISSSFNLEDEKISNSSVSQSKVKGGLAKPCIGQEQSFKNSDDYEQSESTSLPPFCHITPTPHTQPILHLKDIPPPPPPRPTRTHVRSSSLDLNKFSKTASHKSPPPATTGSPSILMKQYVENGPPLQPSWDPRMGNVHEEESLSTSKDHLRSSVTKHNHNSAFEIYKKPLEEDDRSTKESKKDIVSEEDDLDEDDTSQVTSLSVRQNDKREILSSLQTMKEKNSVLQRVNSELNQELAEMIEERIALEFQLEQMKSFST